MDYRILPPDEILDTTVQLPLSKSISARLLTLHALGAQTAPQPPLPPLARCNDTQALQQALALQQGNVNTGPAGTAMRFACAYFAATPGCSVTLDGNSRMRQRPIEPLVEALRSLGADIEYAATQGFCPLRINGRRLNGGRVAIDASISSQFLSALAMVAPTMQQPLELDLSNNIASLPYLKMTMRMLQMCGIDACLEGYTLTVPNGQITVPEGFEVEPDWSAASYWYAITALSAGFVTLPGLLENSLQGDSASALYGQRLGVVTDFNGTDDDDQPIVGAMLSASPEVYGRLEADFAPTPDIAQTFAVAAAMLGVPFRFTGVSTLRNKETDRLQALITEARRLGFVFETEGPDTLLWDGRRFPIAQIPEIETYGDHRMAMAFAPCAVFIPGIVIKDAGVVDKSYPDFWQHLTQAGFTLLDLNEPPANPQAEEQ